MKDTHISSVDFSNHNRESQLQRAYSKYSWLAFLLAALSVLPISHFLAKLRVDNAIESWLNETDSTAHNYAEITRQFGVNEQLIIALECNSLDKRIEAIASKLEANPAILRCLTPQRASEMAADFGVDLRSSPHLKQLSLTSSSGNYSAIAAEIHTDASTDRKALLKEIQLVLRVGGFPNDRFHIGGPTVVNVALDKAAEESMQRLMPIVCAVTFGLLIVCLGDWRLILMMIFCGVMTVTTTLAAMTAAGQSLNLIGIALPPMLLVLSLSFSLHLIHNWREAPNSNTAVGHAVLTTFRPTLLAAGTTAIGCASLGLSQFRPVASFGIWSAIGICIAFLFTYAWAPVYLIGPRSTYARSHSLISRKMANLIVRMPSIAVLLISMILVGFFSLGLTRMSCETDALKFLPDDSDLHDDYSLIEKEIAGLLHIDAIVETSSNLTLPQRIEMVRIVASNIAERSGVERVINWVDYLPTDSYKAAHALSMLFQSENGKSTFGTLLNEHATQWRLTACVKSSESDRLTEIMQALSENTNSQTKVTFSGIVPLILSAQKEIFISLTKSLISAIVILWLVLTIVLKSSHAAFTIVLLNIAPVLTIFGILGWVGHPINMATLTTASIALGVALDDTMHFIDQFRMQARKNLSATRRRLVTKTVRHCFVPMAQTTLIAGLGLAVLGLSSFVPISEFGGLLAALLGCALLGDLVILPSIIISPLGKSLLPVRTLKINEASSN